MTLAVESKQVKQAAGALVQWLWETTHDQEIVGSNLGDVTSISTGALVLWLQETAHVQEAMGSNPGTKYWIDITFFQIDLLQKLNCLLEKTENKRKETGIGPLKKQLKQEVSRTVIHLLMK